MITLVLGGSGSGKSAYAEHLLDGKTSKYYIATMQVYDAEGEKNHPVILICLILKQILYMGC